MRNKEQEKGKEGRRGNKKIGRKEEKLRKSVKAKDERKEKE